MGGLCSKGSAVDKSPSDATLGPDRVVDRHEGGVAKEETKMVLGESAAKRMHEQQQQPSSVPETADSGVAIDAGAVPWDGVPQLARLPSQKSGMGMAKAGAAKASALLMFLVLLTLR